MASAGITIVCAALCGVIFYVLSNFKPNRGQNPPGPKPLPLVGNLFDLPSQPVWRTYAEWKGRYGDVAYMNVLGTPMVILNSLKACTELLDKRSAKYSGRPHLIMLCDLMGWEFNLGFMTYTPRWRSHRRLLHQHFNQHASINHYPVQQRCARHYLQRLLAEPKNFLDHTRLFFAETMLDLVYGIKVKDLNDVHVRNAEEAVHITLLAGMPGRFLVDVFPALRHVPSWFPGARFKRQAAEWKRVILAARNLPFAHVKDKVKNGAAGTSILGTMLGEASERTPEGEEAARDCTAAIYAAGADSTLSTIQALFMAMANNQEIQQAAQAELDTLLDNARLPTFEDTPHLPIVAAISKELLRWHNVAPMGLAHSLTEDDEYEGYTIHRGTIVLGNIWLILHDPETYPEPFKFNPRRWLVDTPEGLKINTSIPDPSIAAFGFGRRHFATNSILLATASVLTCFNIKPLDADGKPAEKVEELFTSAPISYPVPFQVSLTPRSNKIIQLINEQEYSQS